MKTLKPFFWFTDLGFVLYWLVTLLHLIPAALLFNDYTNPILVAWNWLFLPIDLMISATGFTALWLHGRRFETWRSLALVSLTLTFASGLNALSFWVIRAEFDLTWWIPNLYLMIYPLLLAPKLLAQNAQKVTP